MSNLNAPDPRSLNKSAVQIFFLRPPKKNKLGATGPAQPDCQLCEAGYRPTVGFLPGAEVKTNDAPARNDPQGLEFATRFALAGIRHFDPRGVVPRADPDILKNVQVLQSLVPLPARDRRDEVVKKIPPGPGEYPCSRSEHMPGAGHGRNHVACQGMANRVQDDREIPSAADMSIEGASVRPRPTGGTFPENYDFIDVWHHPCDILKVFADHEGDPGRRKVFTHCAQRRRGKKKIAQLIVLADDENRFDRGPIQRIR